MERRTAGSPTAGGQGPDPRVEALQKAVQALREEVGQSAKQAPAAVNVGKQVNQSYSVTVNAPPVQPDEQAKKMKVDLERKMAIQIRNVEQAQRQSEKTLAQLQASIQDQVAASV